MANKRLTSGPLDIAQVLTSNLETGDEALDLAPGRKRMYPGLHATTRPDQPAVVMARSGETITYRELEARSNRLAHLLCAVGLRRLDHYAVLMENHVRFVECCAAGERSGLYYTNVNSFLTAGEVA